MAKNCREERQESVVKKETKNSFFSLSFYLFIIFSFFQKKKGKIIMLYKRKKIMKKTRKIPNRPYIGVIETTMMFQSAQDYKEQLISVSSI